MKDSPINTLQQLMTITMEECGERTQRCSKIMRKYKKLKDIEEDQRKKLMEEIGDVQCMIELMIDHGVVTHKEVAERSEVKREKLTKWSTLVDTDDLLRYTEGTRMDDAYGYYSHLLQKDNK